MAPRKKKSRKPENSDHIMDSLHDYLFTSQSGSECSFGEENYQYCNMDQLKLRPQLAAKYVFMTQKTFRFTGEYHDTDKGTSESPISRYLLSDSNGGFYIIQPSDLENPSNSVKLEKKSLTADQEPDGGSSTWSYAFSSWLYETQKSPSARQTLRVDAEIFDETLILNFYLSKKVIYESYYLFNENYPKPNNIVTDLMYYLHGFELSSSDSFETQPALSVDQFYSRACEKQVENSVFDTVILPPLETLIPTLRTYQESAVKWMIHREKYNNKAKDYVQKVFTDMPLLFGYKDKLYYNQTFGYFLTENVFAEYNKALKPSKGGILADEMGLGKTVETLALILHNRNDAVERNFSFLNRTDLFSLAKTSHWGTLQCFCGAESIPLVEPHTRSSIIESCLRKKYHLNEECIKCLLCGNYQHIQCSGYQVGEDDFPYLCARCWPKVEQIDSGATLIVCPRSILHQWEDEIGKHLRGVSVCIYNGVKNNDNVFAANLAQFDIVLTTYDVLRSELNFTQSFEYEQLRNSRRYYSAISPLLAIHWWRLCFDEAQMVESTYSMVAKMANQLTATYRWAITGTPIQRSVEDLYGLLYFINEEPYCRRPFFETELLEPYINGDAEPLLNAVVSCFWRTPKSAVIEELAILAPIYSEKRLELSQIERDFYQSRATSFHQMIEARFARESPSTTLANVSRQSARMAVLTMATTLRQTCCHPSWALNNVLKRKSRRRKKNQEQTNSIHQAPSRRYVSLDDVLDNMIEEMKYEAEGAHREKIGSLNGVACLQIYNGDYSDAIATYKAALGSIEKFSEHIRTDVTQKYHIYYNLAQIVETVFGVVQVDGTKEEPLAAFNGAQPFTAPFESLEEVSYDEDRLKDLSIDPTSDKLLRSQAKTLYDQYIFNEKLAIITADKYRLELVGKCDDIKKNSYFKGKWFIAALKAIHPYTELDELVEILNHKIHKEHDNFFTAEPSLVALKYKLDQTMESIEDARASMVDSFAPLLEQVIALREVEDFVRCHIKMVRKAAKCTLCTVEKTLKSYEKLLFSLQIKKKSARKRKKGVVEQINSDSDEEDSDEENNRSDDDEEDFDAETNAFNAKIVKRKDEINWNECNTIVALRRVGQLYKVKAKYFKAEESEVMSAEIDHFIELIEETKKEFKAHRRYWTHLSDYVLRLDELNQAQGRMTLPDHTPEMMGWLKMSLDATKESSESKLGSHLDRYRYLKNLKSSLKDRDNVEARMCSICWSELSRYYVLTCGHFFCVTCLSQLTKHGAEFNVPTGKVRCSICRQISNRDLLCSINTVALALEPIEVRGSVSTKVVNIVRSIKTILQTAGDKVLLFSTWPAMLFIMHMALSKNEISSLLVEASKSGSFARNIQTFRRSEDVNVLLLPTNFACNGLNLTEANHVIFVNSSLNRADELQAVGRVYRIGQKKQTYVYKFTITKSIEETIEDTISKVFTGQNGVANSEFDDMTVGEFMKLFEH